MKKPMNDYVLDLVNPITDEERDWILSEIKERPLGQAIRLNLLPAVCTAFGGERIIMIIERDEWRVLVPAHRPQFEPQCEQKLTPPQHTTWHAINRDMSNLRDALEIVRQQLKREGRS